MPPTVSIDFDDTLRSRDDTPIPGAREVLATLRGRGCRILINSARLDPTLWAEQLPHREREIREWLERHDIPFDAIVTHKPSADLYIDDRGFHFQGDWAAAEVAIMARLGLDRA